MCILCDKTATKKTIDKDLAATKEMFTNLKIAYMIKKEIMDKDFIKQRRVLLRHEKLNKYLLKALKTVRAFLKDRITTTELYEANLDLSILDCMRKEPKC